MVRCEPLRWTHNLLRVLSVTGLRELTRMLNPTRFTIVHHVAGILRRRSTGGVHVTRLLSSETRLEVLRWRWWLLWLRWRRRRLDRSTVHVCHGRAGSRWWTYWTARSRSRSTRVGHLHGHTVRVWFTRAHVYLARVVLLVNLGRSWSGPGLHLLGPLWLLWLWLILRLWL